MLGVTIAAMAALTAGSANPVAASEDRPRTQQPSAVQPAPGAATSTKIAPKPIAKRAEQPALQRAAPKSTLQDDLNERQFWVNFALAVIAAIQAALAFFALQGVRHARESAEAAKDALELSRSTAKTQLRAYVDARVIGLSGFAAGGQPLAEVALTNRGQTPARKLRIATQLVVWDPSKPLPDFGFAIPADASQVTLGSQQELKMPVGNGPWLSQDWWNQFQTGSAHLYVFGRVEYEDVFGDPQWATFRAETIDAHPILIVCTDGNESS